MTGADLPLVVDLDGTFIRTDLLLECFWKGMGTAPVSTLRATLRHLGDRPALKSTLARLAPPDVTALPVDPDVVVLVDRARREGTQVVLASGSAEPLVEAVAAEHGPFRRTLGTAGGINLTREAKAARLVSLYGERGFDYIGDSAADIPVWKMARHAYVARPRDRFLARLRREGIAPVAVGASWHWRALLSGMRPHQWLKNTLLVLPLIAAHRLDAAGLLAVVMGFIAFSALASSIYILNDLIDIEADRQHELKRHRCFASGAVTIKAGMAASALLGLAGLAIGAALGGWMLLVLLVYLVSTLSYSMHFKRVRWVDVTMLAGLYTLRVVAGAVAAGVAASGWLFGFIFPVFLCLGCVKRLTELSRATGDGFLPGRRYQPKDRDDLLNVAIIAGVGAVAVFLAYSLSGTASELYAQIWMLWAVAGLLAAWLGRMLWTGWTGHQDYDPIIFAITDRPGLALILASATLLFLAAG